MAPRKRKQPERKKAARRAPGLAVRGLALAGQGVGLAGRLMAFAMLVALSALLTAGAAQMLFDTRSSHRALVERIEALTATMAAGTMPPSEARPWRRRSRRSVMGRPR